MGVRREARQALAAAGVRPRKRWGQHFLCDGGVAERIVDLAELGPGSTVLEIGPGLGALSDALAARAGRLYLIEIDRGLAARLAERYAGDARVQVVVGDVLSLPLGEVVPEPEMTVVANLPYNIATEVLFRLIDLRARISRAVLMLQREVAERLVARPGGGDYGVTSVLVQAFAEVRIAFGVSRRSFFPRPNVDSAVVDLRFAVGPRADIPDVERFRAVVRAAFGQRRKMLHNALAALAVACGDTPDGARARCVQANVDPAARAERLDLAAFARLARAFGS